MFKSTFFRVRLSVLVILIIVFAFDISFAQTPLNVVNSSFEMAGDVSTKAQSWHTYELGYSRASDKKHSGGWSIKVVNSNKNQTRGAYQRIDLNQTVLKPVFISGFVSGKNVAKAPGAWLGASLYAEIHLQDGTIVYWNTPANSGTFDWRWIGFNSSTLPNVNQPIDHIFVVPILSQAAGTAWFDDISVVEYEPTQSAITIMFDDGEDNNYTVAKPIMDNAGFVGSAAIISSAVGDSGYMNQTQIKDLVNSGWEIVSHSVNHEDMALMTTKQANAEFVKSKNQLQNISGTSINNFAYPFGAYNGDLNAQALLAGYKSARPFESGDNPQGIYPHEVKIRKMASTTSLSEVSSWLAQSVDEKKWEVLVFHGIKNSGDDVYYTTPASFAEIIQEIKNSGIQVLTYNAGLNLFKANP